MSFAQQVSKGLVSKYNQIPLLCSEIKVSVTFHDGIEFDPQLLSPPACLGNATANQERDASFQAHDQCRRELCLGHPCGQAPSLEDDRISYAVFCCKTQKPM